MCIRDRVVGIKGNVTFNAKAAAMSYQKYQEKLGGKATYFSTEIHLTGWGDRRKISDGELADYLDTTEGKMCIRDSAGTGMQPDPSATAFAERAGSGSKKKVPGDRNLDPCGRRSGGGSESGRHLSDCRPHLYDGL